MSKKETKIEINDPSETDATGPGSNNSDISHDKSGKDASPDESNGPDNPSDDESDQNADELQAARDEAKESYDRFLRVSAEFDNYKKRVIRETAEFKKFANETLIREILPIIDNLERAIESSATDAETKNGLVEGVDMTLREMLKVFEKFDVKPIAAIGKTFDPCFHQAVTQEKSDDHPDNTVIRELQKGYTMHDRLIRPAMVIVSSAKTDNEAGAESAEGGKPDACSGPAEES